MNINTLKKSVSALAIGTLLGLGQAHATTTDLGLLDTGVTYFGNYLDNGGTFTDYYTFTLGASSTVAGDLFEINIGKWLNVDLSSVSVSGSGLSSALSDASPPNGFTFSGLQAGQYTLTVAGLVTGTAGGLYLGAIEAKQSVASPAPEPAEYALMALGLVGVSLLVRRAKSAT